VVFTIFFVHQLGEKKSSIKKKVLEKGDKLSYIYLFKLAGHWEWLMEC